MTITAADQEAAPAVQRPRGRGEQAVELLVFLFLIMPSMLLSLAAVRQGSVSFVIAAVAAILRDLALVSLILFFLWRNLEPVARIGWSLKRAGREVLLGIVLFPAIFFGTAYVDQALIRAGLSAPSTPLPSFLDARLPSEYLLATVLVAVVAVAEETIFRGYLMLRLTAITRSPAFAALASAVIFSVGHGYEGMAGVVTVGTLGLVLAILYLSRGNLVAAVCVHFLQDFVSIVVLPLAGATS